MMKKAGRRKLAVILLSFLTLGAAASQAHPPLKPVGKPAWQMRMAEELDLTVSQIKKLKHLQRERKAAIRKVILNTPSPLRASLKGGEFDKSLYKKLRLERAKKISKIEAEFLSRVYGMLTPLQKAKFNRLVAGRAESFR